MVKLRSFDHSRSHNAPVSYIIPSVNDRIYHVVIISRATVGLNGASSDEFKVSTSATATSSSSRNQYADENGNVSIAIKPGSMQAASPVAVSPEDRTAQIP